MVTLQSLRDKRFRKKSCVTNTESVLPNPNVALTSWMVAIGLVIETLLSKSCSRE